MPYLISFGILIIALIVFIALERRRNNIQEKFIETKMAIASLETQLRLITQSLNERLEAQNQAVREQGKAIDQRLAVFSELKEKIGNIQSASMNMMEMSRELAGGINNLRNIFTATTTRGVSGEVILENLLRQFIPHNYETQYSFGAEKVDAVIKLDKMIIPVDAKFPYFDRFSEMMAVDISTVEGEKERTRCKKELKKSIRDMIEDVQRKYIRPDLGTSNFAMIYIPAENIYYELVVNDPDSEITNFANQKNVVLVSPSTFFSYLMVIQYGLKGLKLEEETELIFKHLETLAKDMNNFKSDFEVLAGHLTRAYNKLNETNQSFLKIEARFESMLSSDSSETSN